MTSFSIPTVHPIPQTHIHIENISGSSSTMTPSSFSLTMDQYIPKFQNEKYDQYDMKEEENDVQQRPEQMEMVDGNESIIENQLPPPSSYPIPFGSIDFRNFHADFSSPVSADEYDFSEDDFSDDVFQFQL